jgi:uncharacterized protein (TIGR02145 family)
LANGAAPIPVTGSTFKTLCNDGGGYAVYAVGYSNDELGNTDLISSLGSGSNIQTGLYVDSSSPSSWAMKLTNSSSDYATAVINNATGSDFTDFHVVPDHYMKVASFNGSTLNPAAASLDATGNGSTITIIYQAYASYTQPAGTYTGQVKYTMVHPSNVEMPTINDIQYMQDFAGLNNAEKTSVLGSMTVGTGYTLTDQRDDQTYTVAKLSDGNVWMTSDLALARETVLTSGSSNIASNSTYTIPTADLTGEANYGEGQIHSANDKVWYNYCAVSAGTVCDDTTTTAAAYDICPAGWRLPTSTEQTGIASYASTYGGAVGGYYAGGVLNSMTSGYWWSATGDSATNRYDLVYDGTDLTTSSLDKTSGLFVRCVAK